MSFLFPWLLLGAVVAGIPVWLHLRHRRPKNILRFSALRFLDDQPRPQRGAVRLRDPLLLAARLLALLLVVAAFAWPFLRDAEDLVTESRVHILDATMSQQVEGAFADDLEAVRAAVADSGPEVQNAVVLLAGEPSVAVRFSDDRAAADGRLSTLEPTHQRGSYLEAFRLAGSLLDQSLGQQKKIFLYGDHQANQWTEHESAPPFLRDVEVTLEDPPRVRARPNLSLGEPQVRYFFLGDRTFVDLSVELAHQGVEQAAVEIRVGDKEVLSESFDLKRRPRRLTLRAQWRVDPSSPRRGASATSPRGGASATSPRRGASATQWLRGTARVEGTPDDLPADNRSYFCLPPVEEGRVALLARSPYLGVALSPEVMRGRWTTEVLDPAAIDPDVPLEQLPDVLVLEAAYAQSEQVRSLMLRCLNNERGVLLLVDRATPLVKGFLRELGFEVLGPSGDDDSRSRRADGAGQGFRYFATHHPIFLPFLTGNLGDLSQVQVASYSRLRSRPGLSRPLIYSSAGEPLLVESRKTKGRLLLFTFGFGPRQTDWPLQPSFIPFMDLALQYARSATPLETSWRPGELYTLRSPTVTAGGAGADAEAAVPAVSEVVVRGEGGVELRRAPFDSERGARFRVPDQPGLYDLTHDDDPAVRAVLAVNPSPKESRLEYAGEPDALAAWQVATVTDEEAESGADPRLLASLAAAEQRWWWWLLLGALALLTAESGLLFLKTRKAMP
ncbi:MAG: hypothetical protein GY719_38390 [bacterium]|nr:hypothetical protein [bacterium]